MHTLFSVILCNLYPIILIYSPEIILEDLSTMVASTVIIPMLVLELQHFLSDYCLGIEFFEIFTHTTSYY